MSGRRSYSLEESTTSLGKTSCLNGWHVELTESRNQAALVAFTLPQKWKQGAGLSIVATHVDSPNLKVSAYDFCILPFLIEAVQIRPISKRTKQGYLQVGVETYGGGIWHSWLDRDLSIAGRVVISDKNGSFNSKLVKIDQPILRIPTLAIHCMCTFHANIDCPYSLRRSGQERQRQLQVQSRDRVCTHPRVAARSAQRYRI